MFVWLFIHMAADRMGAYSTACFVEAEVSMRLISALIETRRKRLIGENLKKKKQNLCLFTK